MLASHSVRKWTAWTLIAALALTVAVWPPKASASSTLIPLYPNMVTDEANPVLDSAVKLVDEQHLVGDPRAGTGGTPSSKWHPGFSVGAHPASAYIDLGQEYDLTNVYFRDANDSGTLLIEVGEPGSWTTLLTDSLGLYNQWVGHTVSVTTRYVRVTRTVATANIYELALYGSPAVSGPGAISTLAAGTPAAGSIPLSWTVPAGAASYDIRYYTSPITDANWGAAALATGEPTPGSGGSTQSYTLTGLSPSTTYYVAMKWTDSTPLTSPLSNLVTATTTAPGTSVKLALDASMVINETTKGDAWKLVDEQTDDPRAGQNTKPSTYWYPGGNSMYLPGSVVIDLGSEYALTDIYLADGQSSGTASVYSGSPVSWTLLFTDGLSQYKQWIGHSVSTTTRYLRIVLPMNGALINEVVLYGSLVGQPPIPPTPVTPILPTMDQLIGINAFIDDPANKTEVAGFIREYHSWDWDEGDMGFEAIPKGTYIGYPNNQNKFNPSWAGGGGWNFDAYYSGLKTAGKTVAPAIKGNVRWLNSNQNYKPISAGESSVDPASYAEHADHMFQYAARYGSTAVADAKLKLAAGQPRLSGLNTLAYFENWNEPDKWWANGYFTPYEYAAMSSADYDGHLGTMGNTFGIKNADPNAKMVMAGLTGLNLEYIRAIKLWSDAHRGGSFPFDAINVHLYNNNGTNQSDGSIGVSPEQDLMKEQLEDIVEYRNTYLPGKEVWLTEFGYDTHPESVQRAPKIETGTTTSQEEVQGQWIVRSYLAAAAAGIDKAAMYMLRDVDPNSETKFDTSGLTSSQATGYVPKPSWYYVYTLRNRLTGMRYIGEQASNDPNVMIYKFKSATSDAGAYVVWSPTAANVTVPGYSLQLQGSPATATQVLMQSGDTDGIPSSLTISGTNTVTVDVSERPLFVLTDQIQ